MISRTILVKDLAKKLYNMKAILVNEFGDHNVLKYHENLPIPEPNDNQIQIKVHAIGINPIDTYIRSGIHAIKPKLPYTPGFDSAGVITKVGKNISNFNVGDRVFTLESDTGTYAEYTLCPSKSVFLLPDNLSFEEGSALGIPYFTAYKSIYLKANAKPNETVLIHGASGATGLACVQIAKAYGMNIIGTAGTVDGLDLIKNNGADFVFNHKDTDYIDKIKQAFPNGVDIILEMSGHTNLNKDLELLKPKVGRIVIIGCRAPIEINPRLLMAKETMVCGVMLLKSDHDEFQLMNSHLQALMKLNSIKPVIGKLYPLKDAAQAQYDVINNSGSHGKLTLKID